MKLRRMQLGGMCVLAAVAVLALTALPRSTQALGYSGVGGKLGYSTPEDLNGTAELGLHAELEQPGTKVRVLPNAMFWKVDGVRDVNPNLDVTYHFSPEGRMSPYVGGGLGLNFYRNDRTDRSNTELGMNVVGGLRFPGSAQHYFLEGRYTASDIPQASVLAGITFHQ